MEKFGLAAAAAMLLVTTGASAQSSGDVTRGAYLVTAVLACGNCHSPKGPPEVTAGKDFSGGLSWDEPPFKVTASNITPDKETGIGNWSEAELKSFLVTGVRPNGVPVVPLMPTAYYKALTEQDLDAVVAYIRSIPAVKNRTPPPEYRMPLQQETPPGAEKQTQASDLADPVKRGNYLATIGHCLECHTPMEQGVHQFSTRLGAGGREFPGPWGVSVSRNITSDTAAGIGAWTDDEIRRAITQGIHRDGSMLKPPMGYDYYARMTDQDVDAIVAWLRTLPAKP
jgi:mono/diheme cytochrome c family protein